ncbi:hypothetical protein LUU34_00357100 [Aix galericulata]|nr:hypothetical protein LUU34_00357100 [Aix galericulata]
MMGVRNPCGSAWKSLQPVTGKMDLLLLLPAPRKHHPCSVVSVKFGERMRPEAMTFQLLHIGGIYSVFLAQKKMMNYVKIPVSSAGNTEQITVVDSS